MLRARKILSTRPSGHPRNAGLQCAQSLEAVHVSDDARWDHEWHQARSASFSSLPRDPTRGGLLPPKPTAAVAPKRRFGAPRKVGAPDPRFIERVHLQRLDAHHGHELVSVRSADFQSAVSRISNPQTIPIEWRSPTGKSAIQQVGNLRYPSRFMERAHGKRDGATPRTPVATIPPRLGFRRVSRQRAIE